MTLGMFYKVESNMYAHTYKHVNVAYNYVQMRPSIWTMKAT